MEEDKLSIVEQFKKHKAIAEEFWAPSKELSKSDVSFSYGDTHNGAQYLGLEGDFAARESKKLLTCNIVNPSCVKTINSIRMNRPQAKLSPGDAKASEEGAEIVNKWSRSVKSKSNADDATDLAIDYQIRGGEGYFELTVDYVSPDSFEKEIKILPVNDPLNSVWIDPQGIKSRDGSSAEWAYKYEVLPKSEVKMRFGIDPSSWAVDNIMVMKDDCILARYAYCKTEKKTLYQYEDNTSGYDKAFKPLMVDQEGKPVKRETYVKEWWDCILLGGEEEPVHKEEWYGEGIPFIPVWGQLFFENGKYYLKGEVRNQIDSQRVYNFMASKFTNAIARQELGGYLIPVESIPETDDGMKGGWKAEANGIPQKYKLYNHKDASGDQIPMPFKETQAAMSNDMAQAMNIFLQDMHNVTGQFSAPGEISPGASGKAVNARQQQADLATFHLPDNLSRALRFAEEQMLKIFPNITAPGQIIRLLGVDGKEERAVINPEMGGAYAEAQPNNDQGVQHIVNPAMLGNLDVVITIGPSYQTQRQEKAELINEMVNKNPALWQTHPIQIVEAMDLPDKQAWIDQFKKVNPQLAGVDDGQDPAILLQQAQAEAQEMEAALQGATQEMQALQEENRRLKDEAAQAKTQVIVTKSQMAAAELSTREKQLAELSQKASGLDQNGKPIVNDDETIEDEDETDPKMDALLWQFEESNIKQAEQTEQLIGLVTAGQQQIAETLAKPKVKEITITSSSGKVYTGRSIERAEQ
jgi:hypothetical protein